MFKKLFKKSLRTNRKYKLKIKHIKRFSLLVTSLVLALSLTLFFGIKNSIQKHFNDINKTNKLISEEKNPEVKIKNIKESKKSKTPAYNIPLSKDLQDYTYEMCKEYGVDYNLVISVMYQESKFDPNCISPNYRIKNGKKIVASRDFGLCQINSSNHKWLSKKLGITNFLDPKQNIKAGVYMLSLYKDKDIHKTLMSFNMGEGTYKKLASRGITTSKYSRKIDRYRQVLLTNKELKD